MMFVSPHYDDVLLSLPGWLLAQKERGARIEIVVPFSDEDARMERACLAIYRRLDVTVHALGLAEAARRNVSARQLLMPARGQIEGADRQLVESLAGALADRCADEACLVVPSMRLHIDHAITIDALKQSARLTVQSYLDQPYAARWPRVAAAAVAGKTAVALDGDLQAGDRLIGELADVVPQRHIAAILAYRRDRGSAAETLWIDP